MHKLQKATIIALLIGTIKANGNKRSGTGDNSSSNTVYEYMNSLDNANEGMNQFDTEAPYYPEASEQLNNQRDSWETSPYDELPTGTTNGNWQEESADTMQGDGPNDGNNQFETTEPYYPESNDYEQMNQNTQRDSWNSNQDSELQMGSTNGNRRSGNHSTNTVYEYMNALDNANDGTNEFDTKAPYYPEEAEQKNNQRDSWETNQDEKIPFGTDNGNWQQQPTAPMFGDGPNDGSNQFETTEPYYPESNNYEQMNKNSQRDSWDTDQDSEVPMGSTNGNWEQNDDLELTHQQDKFMNTRDDPNSGLNEFETQVPFYPEDTGNNFNTQTNFDTNQEDRSDNEKVNYGDINGNWKDGQAPESERINIEGEGIEHNTTPDHGANHAGFDQETMEYIPQIPLTKDEGNSLNTQRESWDHSDEDVPVDHSVNGNEASQHKDEEESSNVQRTSWGTTDDIPMDHGMNGNEGNQQNTDSDIQGWDRLHNLFGIDWSNGQETAPIMDYDSFMQNSNNNSNAFGLDWSAFGSFSQDP